MNEVTYAWVGYFGIMVLLLLWMTAGIKRTKAKPSETDEDKPDKSTGKLIEGVDYIDEFGVVDLNRDAILHSDYFNIVLSKVPNIESDIEQSRLFYDVVKRLQPYSMKELYRVVQYLRDNATGTPETRNAYRAHITASAIVYDFIIPKALFTDDTVVLSYVAAHMLLHRPVSIFDEVQNYVRQNRSDKDGEGIVEEHKEIEKLSNDLSFANVFLNMVFDYEAFLSIEYLYGRWLDQPAVNAFNVPMYKKDIKYFKKLVTMYFGSMEIDVPKDYIYVDTAVCEYVLQIRRYDPNVNKIKVVG